MKGAHRSSCTVAERNGSPTNLRWGVQGCRSRHSLFAGLWGGVYQGGPAWEKETACKGLLSARLGTSYSVWPSNRL